MACAEFEDRLVDYAALEGEARRVVDAHMETCADCRAFCATLAEVDGALVAAYAGAHLSPAFEQSLLRRVATQAPLRRPSPLPEVLDFVGSAAVLTIIAALLYYLSPPPQAYTWAAAAAGAAILAAGVWLSVRSLVDLKH